MQHLNSRMDDYSQPDFYRFNRDSLELVRWVKEKIFSSDSILDLGAGCGVIGLELAAHFKPSILCLVEIQNDYKSFLESNLRFMPAQSTCEIHYSSFSHWRPSRTYDLIVCNPPYYLPGKGESARDPRRRMAREFVHDDWHVLLDCIKESLSSSGKAFLVIKNEPLILKTIKKLVPTASNTTVDDLVFLELSGLDIQGS
ncbi:MAG TPA: methyltransferase [Bacteriovoracaceae bacterium]|nr:methyltransferase [Bacteriovoracaceae bacterium]